MFVVGLAVSTSGILLLVVCFLAVLVAVGGLVGGFGLVKVAPERAEIRVGVVDRWALLIVEGLDVGLLIELLDCELCLGVGRLLGDLVVDGRRAVRQAGAGAVFAAVDAAE